MTTVGAPAQDARTKPKAMLKLLDAAEKAKKQLSPVGVTDAPMNIECLWEDVSACDPSRGTRLYFAAGAVVASQ